MNNRAPQIRLAAVRHYLNNGDSLRKTAQRFHVYYPTVFKWVKLYKEQGEISLLATYKRPWNRADKELEEKIVLLKEKKPCLTVRKARAVLQKQGIDISIKGIWGIWKRYGYAGFIKEKLSADFTEHCCWTKEAKKRFLLAQGLYNQGDMKNSAEILNSIPVLPKNDFILKVPDSFLSLRRRIEKIARLFGKIPLSSYLELTQSLNEECQKRDLYYSRLRVGLFELAALSYIGDPVRMLKKSGELKKMLTKGGKTISSLLFSARFIILITEGIAYAEFSKIKRAYEIARYCSNLLKKQKHIPNQFRCYLGTLFIRLEDFRKAEYWWSQAWTKANEEERKGLIKHFASVFYFKGDYKKTIHILKNVEKTGWEYNPTVLFCEAMWSLIKGMPHKAISLSTKALSISRKENLNMFILRSYYTIASAYCSLGKKITAKNALERALPFAQKKMKRITDIFRVLLSSVSNDKSSLPPTEDLLPSVKLALLLKHGDYRRAFSYAQRKCLMIYFHRNIFFFPETIINLLEQGKPTGLPRAMSRLPIFNKEIPVYSIKFLGDLIVHKKEKYLKTKLPPKDGAFIINFALKAGEPGSKIFLEDLCTNFWKENPDRTKNLSHLLVRVKKALRIPSYLLQISHRKDEPVLINRGIHFITDYAEFEQTLTTAQAFERAEEWGFAKKEYLRAFKLFRGEPFKKMYDNWSEQMRRVILNRLETEAIHFAKSCLAHDNEIRQKKRRTPSAKCRGGNMADAKRVLEKATKIIPDSYEIKSILESVKSLKIN